MARLERTTQQVKLSRKVCTALVARAENYSAAFAIGSRFLEAAEFFNQQALFVIQICGITHLLHECVLLSFCVTIKTGAVLFFYGLQQH